MNRVRLAQVVSVLALSALACPETESPGGDGSGGTSNGSGVGGTVGTGGSGTGGSAPAGVSVLTRSYDQQRTGANLSETILNTSNVNADRFGKLFDLAVDDEVYAQILYVANAS